MRRVDHMILCLLFLILAFEMIILDESLISALISGLTAIIAATFWYRYLTFSEPHDFGSSTEVDG